MIGAGQYEGNNSALFFQNLIQNTLMASRWRRKEQKNKSWCFLKKKNAKKNFGREREKESRVDQDINKIFLKPNKSRDK